ncbi:MAG: hypothetical protein A2288_00080 [Candidatus Moranbacteria bacterium RIFOXYA12_FULL_44_15]|nr:MAG: hypothetical protein A2288_00080 [Candidatus Moranbacteria bacterium RIFOXYA12_FULL_44_15]
MFCRFLSQAVKGSYCFQKPRDGYDEPDDGQEENGNVEDKRPENILPGFFDGLINRVDFLVLLVDFLQDILFHFFYFGLHLHYSRERGFGELKGYFE